MKILKSVSPKMRLFQQHFNNCECRFFAMYFVEKFSRHLACFNAQIVTNEESGTRIRVSSSSVVFFLQYSRNRCSFIFTIRFRRQKQSAAGCADTFDDPIAFVEQRRINRLEGLERVAGLQRSKIASLLPTQHGHNCKRIIGLVRLLKYKTSHFKNAVLFLLFSFKKFQKQGKDEDCLPSVSFFA